MDNKDTFTFTYSANEQVEVQKIREKYIPKEEDKMQRLRRLDQSVTGAGSVVSLIVGIVSVLILGGGMSCCMVGDEALFIPGIIIGVIGIIGVALAYPLYSLITKKRREKIAPEILRLTEELMK